MRSSGELQSENSEDVDEIEILTTPAIETVTGHLAMSPVKDEAVLLDRATVIYDALDNELKSLRQQIRRRQSIAGIRHDHIADKRMARFKYAVDHTPHKGWSTAYGTSGNSSDQGLLHLNCNWLQDITRNLVRNRPVEVEVATLASRRPFAWGKDKEPSYSEALRHNEAGLAIGALLHRIQAFEYVRPIITVNDTPQPDSILTRDNLRRIMVKQAHDMLTEFGGIGDDAQPGKDFAIVPYSNYIDSYDEFVGRLEDSEAGFIAEYTDGRVYLRPSDRIRQSVNHQFSHHDKELSTQGVLLRHSDGSPSTAMVHAATFMNPINTQFTHLRLHSRYLTDAIGQSIHPVGTEQQVSAFMQALDISHPDRDHNIYYDHRFWPEQAAYAFAFLLRREVQKIIDYAQTLNPVEKTMKPKDYFEHNYTDEEGMWPEDQQGVAAFAAELPLHYAPGDIESAAVIGYGPFSYPALGIAAFMKEGGRIDISDLLPSNIAFAQEWFDNAAEPGHTVAYTRFSDRFKSGKKAGHFYNDCEEQLRRAGRLHVAALEDLESDSAQVVVESFVSCSNNIEKYGFYETIRQKARIMSWTSRSMMISVHMVESGGWNNSGDHEGVTIPAAKLTIEELEDGYRSSGLRIIKSVPLRADTGVRDDYNGMLLVFAKPDTIERPKSVTS